MNELTVHLIGTGAVGLAYGYLLTERGHSVFHTSLRGVPHPDIPVSLQTASGVAQARYTPRYWQNTGQASVAQVNIFAVHGAQLSLAVRQCGSSMSPPACNLIFCSDPDPVGDAWRQVSTDSYTLAYPLLSSEHCGESGLQIVTNREVEIFARPAMVIGERLELVSLFARMGLTVSFVPLSRFQARNLQTAAVYIVLLAVSMRMIDSAQVDVALLSAIHDELLAMATQRDPERFAHVPTDDRRLFRLLAALIAAGGRPGADTLLANSILCLIQDGRRKLIAHLAPITPAWNEYLATRAGKASVQGLISSALAACGASLPTGGHG